MTDGEGEQRSDEVGIPDDAYKDEMYEDETSLKTVRSEDGTRHVTKTGIRPFFARLFADAAKLDLQGLQTRVRVNEGGASEKVFLNPESDGLEHKPAHLSRRMPVWHRLPELEEDEEHDTLTKALYGVLTLAALALPVIGWEAGATAMNAPMIGAAVGTVLLAVESYEAKDGSLSFDEAPRHFVSADASLTMLQNEFADAKTIEEYREIAWSERTRTGLEMKETRDRRDDTMVRQLNERALGTDVDVLGDPLQDEAEELSADERESNESTASAVRSDGGEDVDE